MVLVAYFAKKQKNLARYAKVFKVAYFKKIAKFSALCHGFIGFFATNGCKRKSVSPLSLKLRWEVGFRFSISQQDRHLKIHNALFQLRSSTTMKSFQRSGEGQIPRKSITSRKEISSCQGCKHFHLVSAANQFSRRRGR